MFQFGATSCVCWRILYLDWSLSSFFIMSKMQHHQAKKITWSLLLLIIRFWQQGFIQQQLYKYTMFTGIKTVFKDVNSILCHAWTVPEIRHKPQRCSWSCLGGRSKLRPCYLSSRRSLQPRLSDRDRASPPPAPHKPQLETHNDDRRVGH